MSSSGFGGFNYNMSQGINLLSAVVPLLKLISLTMMGLILAHPSVKMIPRATFKLLSKLVFALFLPCLIFTQLGKSITLEDLRTWWFVPVNVLISTMVGCALGYVVGVICKPPPEFFRFTVVMTGFGNTGNLPIAIIESVCHSADNQFGPNCQTSGIAYVSVSQWVAVILVYTLVYHMMEPPMENYDIVDEGIRDEEITPLHDMSMPLLVEAEWPGMEDKETEHSKSPLIARVFNSIPNLSHQSFSGSDVDAPMPSCTTSPKSVRCLAEPKMVRRIRIVAEQTPVRYILQPPTVASLLAIVIGLVPALRAFVFGDDAPLAFITDSLDILAGAMVPSVMLILGGMLSEGPNDSKIGIKTLVGVTVARLLVLPVLGIGIVALADKMNILVEGDQMYRFVLLLQYTTPSAILLGAIASLRGYAVREASALLFWQHVFAILSLSVYVTLYLNCSRMYEILLDCLFGSMFR